mmetsp:Transcript_5236/g.12604  ORF Transcript_5236/g.12604 Transcript_5236/m.12604 type:complete len:233 (+) Transcript_5236:127-825(+)
MSGVTMNVTNSTASAAATATFSEAVFSLILIPIIFIFVVIFFGLTGARSTKRRNEIKKLKSRVKELAGDERAFGAQALPLAAASLDHIGKETDRCKRIAKDFHPDPKHCSVPGWGRLESKFKSTHFRSSIIQSYDLLQRKIRQDLPEAGASSGDNMLPSDHMIELMKNTPSLEPHLCRLYLSTYERARFGHEDFNEIQYKRVFLRMVKILTLTTNDDLEDFPEEEREAGADM